LYQKAAEIAAAEHATVEEVFASAFGEQLAAWERRQRFLAVMSKVPDAEPEERDGL
ncbi:MAG: hypothetical protein HY013_19390, partial [Candidatus Solibacter usitatus]|nr:hypothetical protein [Candidatus Solibacter usitatus]